MEHEVMFTGVGGQSIQLGAQILARAAVIEDRHVTYLGTYGGTMRGGNTDATLIIADGPVSAPPIVSKVAAALVMHHQFFEPVRAKLRPGSVVVVNESLFEGELDRDAWRVFDIPATQIATELGNTLAACLVLTAAYARLTGVVGLPALVSGMREAVPSYRRQHIESNEKALRAGFEHAVPGVVPVWESAA
jgi:Pyruvate/2-oxoacid:ferredoxin oxidoreductase gamma subunit